MGDAMPATPDQETSTTIGWGRQSPAAMLRELLSGPSIVQAIGAHDALGARLGERAGFDAIWSSGLEVSASHGVPDADILSMSELLTAAQWMASSASIPVVADCDAGYGEAANVMHMVRRYERAGVAGVCVEDKIFPKTNSFLDRGQRLAPVADFVTKIHAAKQAQVDPDFVMIARTEAMIVGLGVDEALRRADAYADAGADAVLVHAKTASPQPVMDFLAQWERPVPVVVVPTTYHSISARELQDAGASMVIYANQGLRAAVAAMSEVFSEIRRFGGTSTVEGRIAPLSTIFDLQNVAELDQDHLVGRAPLARAILVDSAPRHCAPWSAAALRSAGISHVEVLDEDDNPEGKGAAAAVLASCAGRREIVLAGPEASFADSELVARLVLSKGDVAVVVERTDAEASEVEGRLVALPVAQAGTNDGAGQLIGFGEHQGGQGARCLNLVKTTSRGRVQLAAAAARLTAVPGARPDLVDAVAELVAQGGTAQYVEHDGSRSRAARSDRHDKTPAGQTA